MAGEAPPTRRAVADSVLDEVLDPKAKSYVYLKSILEGAKKTAPRMGPENVEAVEGLAPIISAGGRGAGVLETLIRGLKRKKQYPKELKERQRLLLGMSALTAGTGAGAGVAANQLIEALKKKQASAGFNKSGSVLMNTHPIRKEAAHAEGTKAALRKLKEKLLGEGTPGAKERLKKALKRAVYGKEPGRFRGPKKRARASSMKRDVERLKALAAGGLKDTRKAVHENKYTLPTALAGTSAVGTAAVLRKKSKE